MDVFGSNAQYYDLFYREKDYPREVGYVDALIKKYATNDARTILDLGCGTGGHAVLVARKGYRVTGVDRSDAMLTTTKEKKHPGDSVEFQKGDISTARLERSFDVAIAMFAVMGYQTTNERLESTLLNTWHHLNPDGLLIFDAWFGPAVIVQKPHDRVLIAKEGASTIIRLTRPVLDILTHTASVNFIMLHIEDDNLLKRLEETHKMRFFFTKELEFMLAKTGYQAVAIHPFMEREGELTENDRHMAVIARKVPV